ncbi:MAG: tetratricopeptide repeat protein [Candidatus Rifleibacteriota bacterium]
MKYSQELIDAMAVLTDRYGITLVEVPDRFKEKLVQIIGPRHQEEVNHAFKALEAGALRRLRIRAAQKIEPGMLAETKKWLSEVEGYQPQDALDALHLWVPIFKVKTDSSLDDLDEYDFITPEDPVESIDDVTAIVDSTMITAPYDVEIVVNQFDTTTPVKEPQILEYDGKFSDQSFEEVTDFSISEAESDLIDHLESSPSDPGYQEYKDTHPNKTIKKQQKAKKPKVVEPLADPEMPPPWEKTTTEGNVDGAFKALRDGNPQLASRIMMELARNGDTRAQFHLGEFYLQGTGIEKSLEKGKYWLRKAAGRGSIAAKSKLEELENEDNSGGCCGCVVVFFVIYVVIQFLSSLI